MDRSFRQFDVLNDLKVAGRSQPQTFDFVVVDFVRRSFRQRDRAAVARVVVARVRVAHRVAVSFGRPRFLPFGFGLAISLDGGLDEVDESFLALASSSSNSAIRAVSCSTFADCSATRVRSSSMILSRLSMAGL